MSGQSVTGQKRPGTDISVQVVQMKSRLSVARRVLLATGALALLLATDIAGADSMATDRHEVPTFVIKRVEFVTGAETQRLEP